MSEEGAFTYHGIAGEKNIFALPHCQTDRFMRMQLNLTTERYFREESLNFDECRNAYMKPKKPVVLDLLDNLQKFADYE